ncbi:M42 family metallopeptidase [Mycolicibacterium pyrenivorans]|uniref:M42 family metallopeptidase n=1 Tax=Mycolicibacterium pyrenivorans TaxID=187102 RepID=UPI0021F29D51|nr:M20/M25/M40 family metallo-hydrolase [Mycolicibacterium pyrenivorans]MCV7151874.1 M20/M25/M40 family metallo-hydrolase [Mycolicibacterium pyrenivorans]
MNQQLLQELLWAYGPPGQEDAVRDICRRELEACVDRTWVDEAGNLVGLIGGRSSKDGQGVPALRVMAHMDELSMLVKRVEPDGSLRLTPLGTMYPANFGLGPVAILGDHQTLCGVLSLGSEHTTKESRRIWETKPDQGDKALDWSHVYVFSGRTPEELAAAGVRPGTRVCVERSKRTLVEFANYLGSYFMDDRAPVTALLQTAHALREREQRPPADVYIVFTTSEEIGGVGGSYASRTLPGDLTLALEVGPTEAEYSTSVSGGPIIAYGDAQCIYDKDVADRLLHIATELGLSPQPAVLGAFESDASHAKATGLAPKAGLLCLPTSSTHGYEVIAREAIPAMTAVLVEFVRAWRGDRRTD